MYYQLLTGDAELKIQVPTTIYAGEATNGSCVGSINRRIIIIAMNSDDGCSVSPRHTSKPEKIGVQYYRMNFTIICTSGNHSITCVSNRLANNNHDVVQLQGE